VSPVTARSTAKAQPRAGSLRAESGARVRRALVDAALELFAAQGYDETTTTEIAAAAGVSPRTFFRYFPTKERVVFFGEYDFVRSFAVGYLAQPPDMSSITAMAEAFVLLAPSLGRLRGRIRLYQRAVASSTVLRGREREVDDENAATVAMAVAARRGLAEPDRTCELEAHVGMATLRFSLNRWLDGPPNGDLAKHIAGDFGRLAAFAASPNP
jgi:AcrR family transcriptional regulator